MTTELQNTPKFDLKYLHYAIATFIIVGSHFLPQLGPVTPMGCAILGTFVGVIYGWTFLNMLWPSIIGLLSLGYIVGMTNVLGASFGSQIIPMVFLMFALLPILDETNVTEILLSKFVNNKLTKGRPWLFVFFFLLGGYICAQINVFASMLMMSALLIELCKKLQIKPYTPLPTVLFTGIALAAQMGQIMFPFKGTSLTLIAAYSAMTKEMPDFLQYMTFVIPMNLFLLVVYTLICRFILRIDISPLKNISNDTFGIQKHMNSDQKKALLFVIFAIFMLLSTSILPKSWLITQMLGKLTLFGQVAIPILICMLVKKEDGSSLLNFSRSAAKGVSWDAIFMVAFILPISTYMTADETGIKLMISNILAPMTHFPPIVFIILALLFAGLVTNFANNVVLAIVILPVLITFTEQMGMPPLGTACMLFICTQTALFTPGASVPAGLAFANSSWVKASMMMKYAAISVIILLISFFVVGIPYSLLIF